MLHGMDASPDNGPHFTKVENVTDDDILTVTMRFAHTKPYYERATETLYRRYKEVQGVPQYKASNRLNATFVFA